MTNTIAFEKALEGTRVVELGELVTVPYCTKFLSDFGAEVIKIESPGVGDIARSQGPFPNDEPHPERSGLFLFLNTNKLGITLNIKSRGGRKIFMELVRNAHVLVHDKPLSLMKELNLDYDKLSEINPRLVMVSVSPFGATGPHKDYKAYHLNLFHGSGEGYLLPAGNIWDYDFKRPPTKGAGLVGDYTSGASAAIATLAALYVSQLTGKGQHIDISRQESILAINVSDILPYPNEGFLQTRATRAYSVGGITRCKDGYIELLPLEEHMWWALVKVMGSPSWASDPRFQDRSSRAEHGEEINSYIMEWALKHGKDEIYHNAQKEGVPTGIVRTIEDIVNSEQMKQREFFVEIDHPEAGRFKYPSMPFKMSVTPCDVTRPAPLLGQHNEQIYSDLLGYCKQDLVTLRGAGVI